MRPHILFLFIDGIGLGTASPDNPFSTTTFPALERLSGGQRWTSGAAALRENHSCFLPIDACLGVPGLPQSGTGQTALFTGFNAPEIAGRHYGPFPHSATHSLLAEHSLFARLLRAGLEPVFANAFPERFFAYTERTGRYSTTTRMCTATGTRLRTEADVRIGEALTAEITGAAWRDQLGIDVPLLTPAEAGRRLHMLSWKAPLTLFEYFLTDKAGHARDPVRAAEVLGILDGLVSGYLEGFDPDRDLLVVTSDHGNLENLAEKVHTTNPVPLAVLGSGASAFAGASSLVDVTPTLAGLLSPG